MLLLLFLDMIEDNHFDDNSVKYIDNVFVWGGINHKRRVSLVRLPTVPAVNRNFLQQAKCEQDQSVKECELVNEHQLCHFSLLPYMQKQLGERQMK